MVLRWEKIKCELVEKSFFASMNSLWRTKVPGGWFIQMSTDSAFFYSDPEHLWDGSSLP